MSIRGKFPYGVQHDFLTEARKTENLVVNSKDNRVFMCRNNRSDIVAIGNLMFLKLANILHSKHQISTGYQPIVPQQRLSRAQNLIVKYKRTTPPV